MDWQTFWDRLGETPDAHQQVGRRADAPVSDELLDRIADDVAAKLDLRAEHTLLDVCCGNGLLTERLAARCARVTGADFSPVQIAEARKRDVPNATFVVADALRLGDTVDEPFDRVVCYFSFQYFDTYRKGEQALREMANRLAPGGVLLLGDVPDRARWGAFYTTPRSRLRARLATLRGTNPMGKFWSRRELDRLGRGLGLRGTPLSQPDDFLYAHYRFDYRFDREGG
ncbi:MAG: class I SAM-dependent methyltransferase [Rubricoccaceae bacterium]|nr:class I SAM-dependent methyltransferase [Rubricoccaceae bacterium]